MSQLLRSVLNLFPLRIGEVDARSCNIFFEMLDGRGPWDRQHHRRMMQQPGEGELRDRSAMGFCGGVELAPRLRQLARRYRKPRDEGQLMFCAVLHDVLMLPVADVVLVLHADDFDYLPRLVDLVRLYLAQTTVPDLSVLLQSLDRP